MTARVPADTLDFSGEGAIDSMSFEDAMQALEQVVRQLEQGEVPLEEAIALYERGARLRARCEARLQAAEEKIATIVVDEQGKPVGLKRTEGAG